MKLSACYIVKNEAKVLARSLESLQAQVDEIVVLDTGSTDETQQIARKYGARIFTYTWQDDFAAARNEVLRHVTGDWVVFLDADEYFTTDTAGRLRAAVMKRQNKDALLLKRLDIGENEDEVLVDIFVLRVFRNRPELRYSGRIHEELRENGGNITQLGLVPRAELCLIHTGYQQAVNRSKAERNLRILRQELQTTREPGNLYMYLAEACHGLGQYQEAVRYARLDIRQGRRPVVYASRSYHLLLEILSKEPTAFAERRKIAVQAVKDFPELPEFHAELAECLAFIGQYDTAVREMQAALSLVGSDMGLEPAQFMADMVPMGQQRTAFWRRAEKCQRRLKISACIIARDEAAELATWLEHAASFADEIIFIDTGSTDGSSDIARQAGARVYSCDWQQDFSVARNFALGKAGGDWIVFLDADETFIDPQRVRPFLAENEVREISRDAFLVQLINVDADAQEQEINRFWNLRIWRNREIYRYVGKVHECLLENGKPIHNTARAEGLIIRHTGYSSGRVRQKLERNLQLLYAEIEEHGEQPEQYRYLADCCYGLGEYGLALHYARLALQKGPVMVGQNKDLYWQVLHALEKMNKPVTEQLAFLETAQEKFPAEADFYAWRGRLLYEAGRLHEAREALLRFLALYQKTDNANPSQGKSLLAEAYARLSRLSASEGAHDEAEVYLHQSLELDTYREESLVTAASLWPEPAVFVQRLENFYANRQAGLVYLQSWAARGGYLSLAIYLNDLLKTDYGLETADHEIWEDISRGISDDMAQSFLQQTIHGVEQLFFNLIALPKDFQQKFPERCAEWRGLLPAGLQRIAARYQLDNPLEPTDWESCRAGLAALLPLADDDLIMDYAQLALDFSWPQVQEMAGALMDAEKWSVAFSLYQAVPADAVMDGSRFWHDVGICLYQLGASGAAECFVRARQHGCSLADMSAYEAWLEEGKSE